jgi:hypothetical protein
VPTAAPVSIEQVERAIVLMHGHRVMLDSDLAELYGVPVHRLNEQVRRNSQRFPSDFMFQLSDEEFAILRSQSAISRSWGGRRTPPLAFTEQGVAMLSSVLRSERAVHVNVEIMRTFVRLRQMLLGNVELARKLVELETKYDEQFRVVFEAIRKLMTPPATSKKRIGFETDGD